MINIAVLGYGTVGSGVVEVIRTVGDISSISAFTFSFAIATDFCIAEAVQCSIAAIW